jgi:hypothetical protein
MTSFLEKDNTISVVFVRPATQDDFVTREVKSYKKIHEIYNDIVLDEDERKHRILFVGDDHDVARDAFDSISLPRGHVVEWKSMAGNVKFPRVTISHGLKFWFDEDNEEEKESADDEESIQQKPPAKKKRKASVKPEKKKKKVMNKMGYL